jgi:hypothetical protein
LIIKPGSTAWSIRRFERRFVLAPGGGDHGAQKPLEGNDEPMRTEPATRKPE